MVGPREATALVGCCHKIGSQNRRFQDTRSGRTEGPTPAGVKPDLVQYFFCFARRARRMRGLFLGRSRDWGAAPILSNNPALNAVRTQYGSEGRLLFMSRFDV